MIRPLSGTLAVVSLLLVPAPARAGAPSTGFVPVPGGKLFYEERGAGPAVILIHGGMLDHRMWDPQVEALARTFRVIRYDVAGHGQSPAPEGAWREYEHLGLLMEALKVESASLVGLSLGGRIAIDFAIARRRRCARSSSSTRECPGSRSPGGTGWPAPARATAPGGRRREGGRPVPAHVAGRAAPHARAGRSGRLGEGARDGGAERADGRGGR